MRDAFMQGQDIHARTAWQVFELGKPFILPSYAKDGTATYKNMPGITIEEVKEQAKFFRSAAKSINFGIIYGLEAKGLAKDLWNNTDDEHVRKAQGFLNKYKIQYPNVTTYQQAQIAFARRHGYILNMFNRMRMIPDINHSNRGRRSYAERECMNTPVQGSAAEIIKLAMVHMQQEMPDSLRNYLHLVMQIHDEVVNEVGVTHVNEAAHFIKHAMEQPIPGFDIPLIAECAVGHVWGQKKDLEFNEDGSTYVKFKELVDVNGYVLHREVDEHPEFVDRLYRAGVSIKIKQVKAEA
jgi:DNA polymerase I-like protein with 3'-5' exonuclease and polymerase domains